MYLRICMRVRTVACTFMCSYILTSMHGNVVIYSYEDILICCSVFWFTLRRTQWQRVVVCIDVCMYVSIDRYISMSVYIYRYTFIYTHVHEAIYIHMSMHLIVHMNMHTGPGLRPRQSQRQGAFVGSVTSPKATPLHSAMFMRVCLYVWMCGCVRE